MPGSKGAKGHTPASPSSTKKAPAKDASSTLPSSPTAKGASKLQVLYQLARQIVDGAEQNGGVRPTAPSEISRTEFIARYDSTTKYEDLGGDIPPLFEMGSMPGSFNPESSSTASDQPLFDPAMFTDPAFLQSLEQAAEVLLTVPDLNETEWKEWREEEWRERMAEHANINPNDVDFIDERTHGPTVPAPEPHPPHAHSHMHAHDSPAPHKSRPPAHPPPKKPPNSSGRKPTFASWTASERARIRAFWLNLSDAERVDLVNIERDSIYRKLKESQKHSCGCEVCDRTRSAIEEEFEVLFDSYSHDLDLHTRKLLAHRDSGKPAPPGPGPFPGSLEFGPGGKVIGAKPPPPPPPPKSETSDENLHTHPPPAPADIIVVADDLIRNDGRKFADMMENFMVRRLYLEDGRDPDADDSEEKLLIAEKQMDEENKETFFVFAARMFEQRVLQAYRECVAHERQRQLLQELELEEVTNKEREAKKQEQNQKKKDKKKQQKQLKDDEKAQKAAELAAKEAELQAIKEAAQAVTRKKKEEEKARKDALNRAAKEEETRRRKESARVEAAAAEKAASERRIKQEEVDKAAKEAKRIAAEKAAAKAEKERVEKEAREKIERETKEKEEARAKKAMAASLRNGRASSSQGAPASTQRGGKTAVQVLPPSTRQPPTRQPRDAALPPQLVLHPQYARATEFTPLQSQLPSTGYYQPTTPATPTHPPPPNPYTQSIYSPTSPTHHAYNNYTHLPPPQPMQYGHPPSTFQSNQPNYPPGLHQQPEMMYIPHAHSHSPADPLRQSSILQWRASLPEVDNTLNLPPLTPVMLHHEAVELQEPIRRPPSPVITGSSALHADDDEIVIPQGRRVVGQGWGR